MPLQLSEAATDRPQLITYDPAVAAEAAEALKRRATLLAQGFILKTEEPGAIRLEPPPMGPETLLFRVLSQNGDDRLVWDRRDPKQVKEAFAKFKDYLSRGYTAYTILATGKRGHKITEFDPSLQEVLLAAKEVVLVPKTMPG